MTRRIVVIGGGQNAEHEVSLATATAVAQALRSGRFDVDELTIDRDGMWRREADALGSQATGSLAAALSVIERADVVFPAVRLPARRTDRPRAGPTRSSIGYSMAGSARETPRVA